MENKMNDNKLTEMKNIRLSTLELKELNNLLLRSKQRQGTQILRALKYIHKKKATAELYKSKG